MRGDEFIGDRLLSSERCAAAGRECRHAQGPRRTGGSRGCLAKAVRYVGADVSGGKVVKT